MQNNVSGPLISIIIPTYKRSEMLGRAINSALKQTYENIEIIVVDDNNDGDQFREKTEHTMLSFSSEPRIRYIKHHSNLGGSFARNTGIDNAKGDFVAFLDDDDEYFHDKIEKQYYKFESSDIPNLGIIYCGVKIVDKNGKFIRYVQNKVKGDAFNFHMSRNLATCQTLFIPTVILKNVNGFRKLRCGQDHELVLRILSKGYKVDYVNEILVTVYIHDEERISTGVNKIAGKREMYEIKSKYFHLLSNRKINEIKYSYHFYMFRHFVLIKDFGEAFYHYFLAVKYNLFNPRNMIEGIGLVVPYPVIIKIKSILHRLKRLLRNLVK